jgi:AcrR family transcriptional regulator
MLRPQEQSIDGEAMPTMPARVSPISNGLRLPPESPYQGTAERILLAALDRFAEHGYGATSIRDIAGDLGLNSATLYSHFANKEAILAELVLLGHQMHHARLLEAVLASAGDPMAQLLALTREHVLVHCEHPRLAVVANIELHALSDTAAAPALALRAQSVSMLRGILQRGQDSGAFRLVHVDATAAAVASLGMQAAHWFPDPQFDLDAEQLAGHYCSLVARMVTE